MARNRTTVEAMRVRDISPHAIGAYRSPRGEGNRDNSLCVGSPSGKHGPTFRDRDADNFSTDRAKGGDKFTSF